MGHSIDTAGLISTGGTLGRAKYLPTKDATVTARLRAAGAIVSYLDLVQISGAGKTSHLLMVEYPNMAVLDTINEKIGEASQRVLGKPFGEAIAEFTKMRDYLRTEYYGAPVQQ